MSIAFGVLMFIFATVVNYLARIYFTVKRPNVSPERIEQTFVRVELLIALPFAILTMVLT